MLSKVRADDLKDDLFAENCRTNETVRLVGKLTLDNGVELWVVDGEKGLYMEHEYNLIEPFYWG